MIYKVIFFTSLFVVNVSLSFLVGSYTSSSQQNQVLYRNHKSKRKHDDVSNPCNRDTLQTLSISSDAPESNNSFGKIKLHKKTSPKDEREDAYQDLHSVGPTWPQFSTSDSQQNQLLHGSHKVLCKDVLSDHYDCDKLKTSSILSDTPEVNSSFGKIKPYKKTSKKEESRKDTCQDIVHSIDRVGEKPSAQYTLKNNKQGYHDIHLAVINKTKEKAKWLLEELPDLANLRTSKIYGKNSGLRVESQSSPLHFAIVSNDLDGVKLLLQAFSDPRLTNGKGHNCLHLIITKDMYENDIQIKIIEALLSADPILINIPSSIVKKNEEGYLPLHCAVLKNKETIVELLLGYGATIIGRSHKGKTVLHMLFKKESYKQDIAKKEVILKTLMSKLRLHSKFIELINQKDRKGNTALHMAVMLGDKFIELIKIMVEAGAYIDVKNKLGRTPCAIALEDDFVKGNRILEYFLSKHPEVVAREKESLIPPVSSLERPPLRFIIPQNSKENEAEIGAWLLSSSSSSVSSSSSSVSSSSSSSVPKRLKDLPYEPDSQLSQFFNNLQEPLNHIKGAFNKCPHHFINAIQQEVLEPLLSRYSLQNIFQAVISNKVFYDDQITIIITAFKNLIQTRWQSLLEKNSEEELAFLLKCCDSRKNLSTDLHP